MVKPEHGIMTTTILRTCSTKSLISPYLWPPHGLVMVSSQLEFLNWSFLSTQHPKKCDSSLRFQSTRTHWLGLIIEEQVSIPTPITVGRQWWHIVTNEIHTAHCPFTVPSWLKWLLAVLRRSSDKHLKWETGKDLHVWMLDPLLNYP